MNTRVRKVNKLNNNTYMTTSYSLDEYIFISLFKGIFKLIWSFCKWTVFLPFTLVFRLFKRN